MIETDESDLESKAGGDGTKKKAGKFSRLMNWVDKKLCGGGTPK